MTDVSECLRELAAVRRQLEAIERHLRSLAGKPSITISQWLRLKGYIVSYGWPRMIEAASRLFAEGYSLTDVVTMHDWGRKKRFLACLKHYHEENFSESSPEAEAVAS